MKNCHPYWNHYWNMQYVFKLFYYIIIIIIIIIIVIIIIRSYFWTILYASTIITSYITQW